MNDEQRALLIVAAHFLSYPTEKFINEGQALDSTLKSYIQRDEVKHKLHQMYKSFFQLSLQDLQELFVDTFDLKEKLGLYLTAHELGDSNKRGAALIKLQKLINTSGFEREEGELADYIPMLFEFLAVAPETSESKRLYRRLSVAVHRMLSHISKENLYEKVLHLLMTYVFPHPTEEEIKSLEFHREEADLEELPYPIMYQ